MYKCSKEEHETGQMKRADGFLSKMFDIQNKKFITVSCKKCGFTRYT